MRTILVLVAILGVATAWCDGAFFKGDQAVEPTVPDQRAVVVWDKGVQTLVVDSTLQGDAGSYSWVLPLPSVPARLDAVRPSVYRVSVRGLQPKFHPSRAHEIPGLAATAACLVLAAVAMGLVGRGAPAWARLRTYLWLAAAAAAVGSVAGMLANPASKAASTFGAEESAAGFARPADDRAPEVAWQGEVGRYDVVVVRGRDPSALVQWLEDAGTPLPDRCGPVVAGYVREGWCFVVAKLRKEADGEFRPHPVKATFPAPRPVYPMRLTQFVSKSLDLELLVVGPSVADAPGLRILAAKTTAAVPDPGSRDRYGSSYDRDSEVTLAHDDLAGLVGAGAVATRLRGTLSQAAMGQDVSIGWLEGDPGEHRPTFHTVASAEAEGRRLGIMAAMLGAFLAGAAAILREWGLRQSLATPLGLALVLGGGVSWLATPRQDVLHEVRQQSHAKAAGFEGFSAVRVVEYAIRLASVPGGQPFPDRLERHVREGLRRSGAPAGTKLPLAEPGGEDVGQYSVEKTAPGRYLVRMMRYDGSIVEHEAAD